MPFTFKPLSIPEVVLVTPQVYPDDRGYFMELFKSSDFERAGLPQFFSQDNYSLSKKNVLRGLHYQEAPHDQGKLVSVIRGAVWDVAVDIRKESPTFLQWVAADLDDQNRAMLYVPPGFAHGFLALSDDVHLAYKCTKEYNAGADRGIRWNDPDIAIPWPVDNPVLSQKDYCLPFVRESL